MGLGIYGNNLRVPELAVMSRCNSGVITDNFFRAYINALVNETLDEFAFFCVNTMLVDGFDLVEEDWARRALGGLFLYFLHKQGVDVSACHYTLRNYDREYDPIMSARALNNMHPYDESHPEFRWADWDVERVPRESVLDGIFWFDKDRGVWSVIEKMELLNELTEAFWELVDNHQ